MNSSRPPKPDAFIPIRDDDDDAPTVARNLGPLAASTQVPAQAPIALPRRPSSTAPYSSLAPPSASPPSGKRPSLPPPPPAAAFSPPLPPSLASPGPVFVAPPPPAMPVSRAFPDSPFDPDMPTPPPPSMNELDEFAAPTPPPPRNDLPPPSPPSLFAGGPPRGRPTPHATLPSWGDQAPPAPSYAAPSNGWASAPMNLQAPETIDFSADAQPLTVRRSGPPGLVVLIVLLAAAAGGAKLAHVVTRADVAALAEPPTPK